MNPLSDAPNGKLILENGLSLEGFSFGARKGMAGEVVFNTRYGNSKLYLYFASLML